MVDRKHKILVGKLLDSIYLEDQQDERISGLRVCEDGKQMQQAQDNIQF
jgi:hypothetical protein